MNIILIPVYDGPEGSSMFLANSIRDDYDSDQRFNVFDFSGKYSEFIISVTFKNDEDNIALFMEHYYSFIFKPYHVNIIANFNFTDLDKIIDFVKIRNINTEIILGLKSDIYTIFTVSQLSRDQNKKFFFWIHRGRINDLIKAKFKLIKKKPYA